MKSTIMLTAALVLAGCSITAPVVGQFTGSKDEFMGQATAGVSDGTLHIRSQSGITCGGTIIRPSTISGDGEIRCSDGRTGKFVFTKSNERGGTGFGTLSDGEKFRFLWGSDVRGRARCDDETNGVACSRY